MNLIPPHRVRARGDARAFPLGIKMIGADLFRSAPILSEAFLEFCGVPAFGFHRALTLKRFTRLVETVVFKSPTDAI